MAALLLFLGQTLSVQHVHADGPEPACSVCVSAQQDDDGLPTARLYDCEQSISGAWLTEAEPTPQAKEQPLQLARSPPAR